MIVSCESCKSRYKLDDSKVTGRGAKITCPKCKHVFVVLAPAPAPMELTRPALQGAPVTSDWEDDEPTRVGKESTNIAQMAVEASQQITAKPSPSKLASPIPSAYEVALPKSAPVAAPAMSKEESTTKAAALDFRKVGVTAWKVKVKIGLVYDFSDLRTLRKYIADGRVTSADVISHDGKSWKPLGEIPDLDLFFIEAYGRIETEFVAKGGGRKKDEPSDVDMGNVAEAIAAAVAAEEESASRGDKATGPIYQDPFESLKQKQRERVQSKRGAAPVVVRKTPPGLWAAVVALVVIGGAGAWWFSQEDPPPPPPVATKAATKGSKTGPTKEEIQQAIIEGSAPVKDKGTPADDEPESGEGPTAAVPRVPAAPIVVSEAGTPGCERLFEGRCVTAVGPSAGSIARLSNPGTIAAPANAPSGSGQTATDHESNGDEARKSGDWDTAVIAYGKAIEAKGKSATLLYKYGEAQLKAGDPDAAAGTLDSAVKAGESRAHKLLGGIAEKNGDTAGAIAHYESYLSVNPNDSEVKSRLDALAG